MSEENTERLEGGTPFEIRVLRELANINQRFNGLEDRLTSLEGRLSSLENRFDGLVNRFTEWEDRLAGLEEKVDARLRETRPIWEAVLTRLERMEKKLDVFGKDLLETRVDVELLKNRLPAA